MAKLIENPEEIKLTEREEILAIMGNPPGWILRWGITVIFFVVGALLLVSYLVEYADTIPAEVTLTTQNPPIPVVAKANGKITNLQVKDKDQVYKNQLLAILENPAWYEDVRALEEYLLHFESVDDPVAYLAIPEAPELTLGTLQPDYAALDQKLRSYKDYLKQTSVFRRINALQEQIFQIGKLNGTLRQKEKNLIAQRDLAAKNLARYQKLLESGAGSQIQVEEANTTYLQAQRLLDDVQSEYINNQIKIENLRAEIATLKGERATGHSEKQTELQELVQVLKGKIEAWKQQYLLIAPISGQIAFTQVWSENQPLTAGQEVFTIVPKTDRDEPGKIIGRARLAVLGSGKVDTGQVVNIELDAYPAAEFGILKGQVAKISDVPDAGQYLLEIALPDSLQTTYHKNIEFRQGMVGRAYIITEKRRFILRLLDRLLDAIYNR